MLSTYLLSHQMLITILQEGFRSSTVKLKKSKLGVAKQPVKTKTTSFDRVGNQGWSQCSPATIRLSAFICIVLRLLLSRSVVSDSVQPHAL